MKYSMLASRQFGPPSLPLSHTQTAGSVELNVRGRLVVVGAGELNH